VVLTATGDNAEAVFVETVDRLFDPRGDDHLSAEHFAPLQAGAGIYARMEPDRFSPGAETGESGGEEPEESGPPSGIDGAILFGAHAEERGLALELALPSEVLAKIAAKVWPEERNRIPPELWPPPPAPARETDDADSGDKAAGDEATEDSKIHVPGPDDVTLPQLVHKISPDYPELARVYRLESRIILQAIVSEEGTVEIDSVLNCDGKSMDEEERRSNLDTESTFCLLFSEAAIDAVKNWRYEPALKNGEPVAVFFTVRVDFELQ
jgi:hypothetical protein